MTYKKVYRFCDGEIVDGLNRTRYNPKKEDDMQCICTILNALIHEVNKSHKENKELIKELNRQNNVFEFNFTEDFTGFDKDELYINDTHTKIELKNGMMGVTVFIPHLKEFVKIKYRVTKQGLMREYLELNEEMKQWNLLVLKLRKKQKK